MTTIRPLEADDDLEAEIDLRHRAFGPIGPGHRETLIVRAQACVVDGRLFGAFDRSQMIGSARYYDLRQWWHGRALPMAGVGGVKVAPEARGRGIGRALMTGMLTAMSERGCPLSVLYPSTLPFYRSLGWEQAGAFYHTEIPARALTSLLSLDPELVPPARSGDGGAAALRRAGSGDAEEVLAKVIEVSTLIAGSAPTAATLWRIVGSHAGQARTVRACVGPRDPIGWLTTEPGVVASPWGRWMLRVVDPVAAVAGRGFPPGAEISVPLRLADATVAANSGCYTLRVADGAGSLVKVGSAGDGGPVAEAVALGPRGFAALFAGVPMATLRIAGLAAGGDQRADGQLDSAFGCTPFMLDVF